MESAEKYGWQKKGKEKKRVVDDTHKRGEIFFCRQFRYNNQSYTSQALKKTEKEMLRTDIWKFKKWAGYW